MPQVGSPREPVVSAHLTWGDPITDPASALGQLEFDVVIAEHHERSTEVTDHSVEQGTAVVDHVRPNPDRLNLEVFVSNTPIRPNANDGQVLPLVLDLDPPGQGGFFTGGSSALLERGLQAVGLAKGFPTQVTANVLQFSEDTDYVQNTYNILTQLRDTATLLAIPTPRQTYFNMVIEKISMERDRQTGTSATFSIDFRQIRIVSSSIVDAPLPSIPRAVPNIDKGKRDPKAVSQPKQSVLLHEAQRMGISVGNGQASNVGAQ